MSDAALKHVNRNMIYEQMPWKLLPNKAALNVRPSIHPQKVFAISKKLGM